MPGDRISPDETISLCGGRILLPGLSSFGFLFLLALAMFTVNPKRSSAAERREREMLQGSCIRHPDLSRISSLVVKYSIEKVLSQSIWIGQFCRQDSSWCHISLHLITCFLVRTMVPYLFCGAELRMSIFSSCIDILYLTLGSPVKLLVRDCFHWKGMLFLIERVSRNFV